jgi:hypothetical protein
MQLTRSLQTIYNARAITYYVVLATIKREEEPQRLIVSLFVCPAGRLDLG